MKTYVEWLEDFRKKIYEGYEKHRMDKRLAGHVCEVKKPARKLLKLSGPVMVYGVPESGELPPSVVVGTQDVTPSNVGFPIDMRDWAEDPSRRNMDTFMTKKGKEVAENETRVIIKGMIDNVGYSFNAERKGELSKTDIRKAEDWLKEREVHPDTIIVDVKQGFEFLRRGEVLEAARIPSSYMPEEQRGPYFLGLLGGLKVYCIQFDERLAIVYRKNDIIVKNTPLKIYFDNLDRPSKLILEKWCSSAPIIDEGVVKITL